MNIEEIFSKWKGKEPKEVISLGDFPIAYPGLTILHGVSGSMKSYASVSIASKMDYDAVFYLDFEGNSLDFKNHCTKNNVFYLNLSYGSKDEFKNFLVDIAKIDNSKKILVIADSFSRIFIEPVNEVHKIDEIFKFLKYQCTENNYSLLLIDHSRKTDFGIEIRGGDNKKKFADVVLSIEDTDIDNFKAKIKVEKSRLIDFKINDIFEIITVKKDYKQEFINLIIKKELQNKKDCYQKLSKKQRNIYKKYINNFYTILKEAK